jgi:hypothetical protein
MGDLALQGQCRLTLFEEVPTISLTFGETLPTGKYDRLSANASDALGTGAYTSTLSVYSQYFFWVPNGRILLQRSTWSSDGDQNRDLRRFTLEQRSFSLDAPLVSR